jgi:hypothetical protein
MRNKTQLLYALPSEQLSHFNLIFRDIPSSRPVSHGSSLYTTVAIFSAPKILSESQNKSVQSVLENVMKDAIMSAAPARTGWAP